MKRFRNFNQKPSAPLDVLFVSTTQSDGGASIAAYRLFKGVRSLGLSCQFLAFVRQTDGLGVSGPKEKSLRARICRKYSILEQLPIRKYPSRKATPFTVSKSRNLFRPRYEKKNAKLIHLHWVAKSTLDFHHLPPKTPIIWTLHDAWPFTGGCHYSQDCSRFEQNCGACPQLGSDSESDISRVSWHLKKKLVDAMDLTVVAPSTWLANQARLSSIFAEKKVLVIPNGIDTTIYQPIDKSKSRLSLGIDERIPVLLFGAQSVNDHRKGTDLLVELLESIDFQCLALTFGGGKLPMISNGNVEVRNLGSITDDRTLACVYSAADVFVCPSREDNLPNTVMESMSCATPVIAFHVNGLSDLIDHKVNGYLCRPFDVTELLDGVKFLLSHDKGDACGLAARQKVEQTFDLNIIANRYRKLYDAAVLAGENH